MPRRAFAKGAAAAAAEIIEQAHVIQILATYATPRMSTEADLAWSFVTLVVSQSKKPFSARTAFVES